LGQRSAHIRVAFSPDRVRFGKPRPVRLDELGEARRTGETYGAIMTASGARAVRVWSDRPLRRLTVLAVSDRGPPTPRLVRRIAHAAGCHLAGRLGCGRVVALRLDR